MRGLGPKSKKWLAEIGVRSVRDIEKRGIAQTYLDLRANNSSVSLNMLWGLASAVLDVDWRDLPAEVKAQLKAEVEAAS